MKCSECKYCKQIGRAEKQSRANVAYSRKYYYCENPNLDSSIWGFVGYGDTTKESPLQLKTCKKWCPLKEVKN